VRKSSIIPLILLFTYILFLLSSCSPKQDTYQETETTVTTSVETTTEKETENMEVISYKDPEMPYLFFDPCDSLAEFEWRTSGVSDQVIIGDSTLDNKSLQVEEGYFGIYADKETGTYASVGKSVDIGSGPWIFEIRMDIKDLIVPSANKEWRGLVFDIFAANKRFYIAINGNGNVYGQQGNNNTQTPIRVENYKGFHTWRFIYNGVSKMFVLVDDQPVGSFDGPWTVADAPDGINIRNVPLNIEKGKNHVIIDHIGFSKEGIPDWIESRMKMLEKMERIDKPNLTEQKILIRLKTDVVSSNDVLWVEDLSKSYGSKHLFSHLTFQIRRGEKVFVTGPNGCGKSTLLKIISGKIEPDEGEFHIAKTVKTAYFDQELENLDPDNTIIDEVWAGNEKVTETQIRNLLAAFLFKGDDVFKIINTLSGGEQTRVSIAKLLLSDADFLILDEPTNNLDISSREVLENALMEFEGAVLCVSHDRYFVQKIGTRFLNFTPQGITDFTGDYEAWQERLAQEKERTESRKTEKSQKALDYLRRKELSSEYRKIKNAMERLEKEIEEIEEQIRLIETEMSDPDYSSDHERLTELQERLDEQSGILEQKYEEWASKEDAYRSFLQEHGDIIV
jgi:ABC-type multidrug transport system ATPase subunit